MGLGFLRIAGFTGPLSNQGEKSTNFYFIMVPVRKKGLKYGTPKLSLGILTGLGVWGFRVS